MAFPGSKVVDIHTHMYPPEYISILTSRETIPLVRTFGDDASQDPRLILLEAEIPSLKLALKDPSAPIPGRPLTSHYASLSQKIHFMDTHKIDISVVSLANPWLDFLTPEEASGSLPATINADFERMCSLHPGRLFFFATLPLTAPSTQIILGSITSSSQLKHCRGVIMGTSGLGKGLDDPNLLPVFKALAEAKLPVFLHPHYGLPNSVYGPQQENYGHVLPLALGFPMETTIAVTRMYLAGVFDAVPELRMILAHSGGTLPFLAGRIDSCITHDGVLLKRFKEEKRRTIWEVLEEQVYLDAVVYSDVGLKAAIAASGEWGVERLMFGTDHPFFPPLETDEQGEWESVRLNARAVKMALGEGKDAEMVMGGNAVRLLRLVEE
ncbi:2-amino-3-carboxymuconate-6-semialdehyde decarboxylase [Cladorrhinum sp. PSN259]|nr:2-amino-3-carboxymuconate-6-semialdehyde decarboxylase [Cladorrhinum sp. PSN259]